MKNFFDLREAVRSANKKPEKYVGPDDKPKVRMAPVDKEVVKEKTLTPAELKKREEIAKAIKRENPNMPMAKKMAIATATAKKVAEEVEQIDEISTDLAHDVYKKRAAQAQSLGKQSGDEPDIKKANVIARAGHKAQKKADTTHLRMIKKILRREEVELDEISNEMKARYIRKSSSDYTHSNAVRKDAEATGKTDLAVKMKARMKKRNQGMTRAFGGERD